MKIVIIGDGKVGHKLTTQLSEEDYDITLIDQNAGKLKAALNNLDIFCINGNGADAEVLKQADVPHADIVIACTSTDEMNMISCLLAKRLGAKHTIARVRNPLYYRQMELLKEDLHLSMAVNPELAAANEISRMLLFPEANKVESFMKGRVELVEFPISETSPIVGLSLAEINKKYEFQILVCAIKRGEQVYIPDGNFELHQGDVVSFIAASKAAKEFFERIGMPNKPVHNTMIIGGGKAAYYLGKMLLDMGIEVKIIEMDRKRCRELSVLLPQATIINGDGTDEELLKEEEIAYVDSLVPLTGIDEENVLLALHAREVSDAKVITKVNRNAFHNLIDKLDLGSVIYPKYITAEAIVAYVRAKQASMDSSNVETIYHMFDSRAEAIEFNVSASSRVTDVPLKDLNTKDNLLIACINRYGKIIIPGGMDCIQAGDTVVIVTTHTGFQNIEDILR